MSTRALMTAEQFAQTNTADMQDFELVEGELVPLSSGTYRHNKIRDLVGRPLGNYFEGNPIGDSVSKNDCQIDFNTVRRLGNRIHQIDLDKIPAPFAPDIAVEVLSPSQSAVDVRRKVLDYLRAGSKEVWLLDHSNGELLVHTDGAIRVLQGADALVSPLLSGFSAAVADLLAGRGTSREP